MWRIALAALLALSSSFVASFSPPAAATTFKKIWNFKTAALGYPYGRVIFDGSLLVGTGSGDDNGTQIGDGQVFSLANSGGKWSENGLVKFDGTDGAVPFTGLVVAGGYLYGTTAGGDAYGHGNVFSLYKTGSSWTEATVYAFGATSGDGNQPQGDLILDSAGNIYGTTYYGGAYGKGIAFELTEKSGTWTETILHSFGNGSDGASPTAGLVLDSSGNLYGTTQQGGGNSTYCKGGCGAVFELTLSGGKWSEKVLYAFDGTHGAFPTGALIRDSKGDLYSTTQQGGSYSYGEVFELYLSGGVWKETILHDFDDTDGATPLAALRWDGNGTFYGTTAKGGTYGDGTVFEMSNASGKWTFTSLHAFANGDGTYPASQLATDSSGNLYGTSLLGGNYKYGTVWELTP